MIVNNDAANRHLARVIVIPTTGNVGRPYPGETVVSVDGRPSKVVADQIMAADKARLKGRLGVLSRTEMATVDDAIRVQLALPR